MILAKNLKHREILIEPFLEDQEEQVSVDLRIGDFFQESGSADWRTIKKEIVIAPGNCLLVQTKELLKMPNDAFGILNTKGSMAAKGIIIANTKLDPLFEGNLNIPVFNAGNRKAVLKKGDKFCSIVFWGTEGPIVGRSTRNAIRLQPRDGNKMLDFLSQNMPHIITGAASILASVIAAVITLKFGK